MPGDILDDLGDIEDPGFKLWRSSGGRGRGPIGGPGAGPAGVSLGYGSGGGGPMSGPGYVGSGGYSRRRRPVGGFQGQVSTGGAGTRPVFQSQSFASSPPSAPSPKGLNQATPAGGGGAFGGRIRHLMRRGRGRPGPLTPPAPGPQQPAPRPGVDMGPEVGEYLYNFIHGGGLSPGGSEAELEAIRGEVRRANSAGRARAKNRARVSAGGDPGALAYADIMSEVQGNRALSETMGGARANIADRQARFGLDQFMRAVENDRAWRARDQAAALGRRAQDHQGGGGLGDFLADLGGTAIGSLIPGIGRRGRRGGGGGGGDFFDDPGDYQDYFG